ncbi:hypothetical protein L3V77_09795 [Vibrio sp. DW001]|uniref:hypothetical protein n=1 Tax=Vibrio sp. DW001 TaxID=2912315 RepID=UPI0023AEDB91|nr:hypothetical protein [Vibrio sp. DW001]WED25365.1 hypothetical protein L3V77_09795 [Vibrio sp. DW001]
MKFLTISLLVGLFFALLGFKKNKPRLQNIGVNVAALIVIYVVASMAGPARYTIDLEQSPVVIDNKSYLVAWKINRVLPFEWLAVAKYVDHDTKTGGIDQYKRIPEKQRRELKQSYQGEGLFTQYLIFILFTAWIIVYRKKIKRRPVSIHLSTPTTTQGKMNKQAINDCTSLVVLNEWIDTIQKKPFYRFYYKKSRLALCHTRKISLQKELSQAFYAIAKSIHIRANTSSGGTFDNNSEKGYLPLWVAKMLLKGEYEFGIDIELKAEGPHPKLEHLTTYGRNVKKSNSEEKTHTLVWQDDRPTESIKKTIEKPLIDSIESSLNAILPRGLVTFSKDSTTRIKLSISSVDYTDNADNIVQFALGEKYYLFATPSYQLSTNILGSGFLLSSKSVPLQNPQITDISNKALTSEPKIKMPKPKENKIPSFCTNIVKVKIISSVIETLFIPLPSSGVKTSMAAARKIDELYTELANDVQSAVLDELTSEAMDIAIQNMIENDPVMFVSLLDSVSSELLSLGIEQELLSEMASSIMAEVAAMAITGLIED